MMPVGGGDASPLPGGFIIAELRSEQRERLLCNRPDVRRGAVREIPNVGIFQQRWSKSGLLMGQIKQTFRQVLANDLTLPHGHERLKERWCDGAKRIAIIPVAKRTCQNV